MAPFTAAPHHDVLLLLLRAALLLIAARAMGEIAQRLKQPAVLGELLAGILLGPSLISGVVPALGHVIIPQSQLQGYLLEVVSMLGAIFLMIATGLETDLALIRRQARTAIGVSLGGIIVPFATGFWLGEIMPDSLLMNPLQRTVFSLFVATALSISAIPVIAKVLIDMQIIRRNIGQTIIAAGMTDDTIGWVMLSIVGGLAAGQHFRVDDALIAVGRVVGFLAISATVGFWAARRLTHWVLHHAKSSNLMLSVVIACALLWGALAHLLSLEAVLGAFIMGILFGQIPQLPEVVHDHIKGIGLGVFAPIFFAVAGLKVNASILLDPTLLGYTLLVIGVATFGKFAGAYVGARWFGRTDHWTALSYGAGLNARGAMEIIVATIGLQAGILSQDMFSMIVVMAMATSIMAPPLLRWTLRHIQLTDDELARLQHESTAAQSVIANVQRVLLPIRLRPGADALHPIEAALLEHMGRLQQLSVTLLNVARPGERAAGQALLDTLAHKFPHATAIKKVVESTAPADAILDEVQRGHDLLVLGASEHDPRADALFNPMVDYLVRVAPCPTMVVRGQRFTPEWTPQRILVPTNGNAAGRHAAELAFTLAAGTSSEVIIMNVVSRTLDSRIDITRTALERHWVAAQQIVEQLRQLGATYGVTARSLVHRGDSAKGAILEVAQQEDVNLIILGTDLRAGADRLFFGPRVEHILHTAPCPVILLNVG